MPGLVVDKLGDEYKLKQMAEEEKEKKKFKNSGNRRSLRQGDEQFRSGGEERRLKMASIESDQGNEKPRVRDSLKFYDP